MKPPRIPTWLLALVTALLLGGAGALFVAGTDRHGPRRPASGTDVSSDDSVLELPKKTDTPVDTRRRGEEGRTRIDVPDDTADPVPDTKSSDPAATRLKSLSGIRVTLAAADASGPELARPAATTKVGGVAVPCMAPASSTPARSRERQVLDALTTQLRSAGAIVIRVDDAGGSAPCAPARIAQFERADVGLVLASAGSSDTPDAITPGATPLVVAGRRAGSTTTADAAHAARITGALAAALGVTATTTPPPALLRLLTAHGVIDLPGGGTTVWVAAPTTKDPAVVARSMALALATASAPAGTAPSPSAPATTAP